MMKYITFTFFLCCCAGFASVAQDWEAQKNYDENLSEVLLQIRIIVGTDSLPDFRDILNHQDVDTEIIPISTIPKAYRYYLDEATNRGVRIKAENKFGGRNYIYDYEWNVVHYVFLTPDEAQRIGKVLVDWVTTDKYPMPPDGREWVWILTALGYRGCFTDMTYYDDARFDILGCFGDFLVYDDLRERVWTLVLGGKIFKDEQNRISVLREKVVRSILSDYDSYPESLQKEALEKVSKYLETVDDEKTNYSKQIAEFILKKGGTVPDRLYWDYDTSSIPFHGGIRFREGMTRSTAVLQSKMSSTNSPPRGAEGSDGSVKGVSKGVTH